MSKKSLSTPLIAAVASQLAFAACLPDPMSVKERREQFDRDELQGSLLFNAPPPNMVKVGAEFGGKARLLGYTMKPESPRAGDRVTITFYWTAIAPMAEDYEVFIHGDAIGGNSSRLHGDHYPAKGEYPTDVWREGDVIADPFTVWIPPNYGPKTLGIYTGLYLGNYRVPLSNKGLAESDNENRSRAVTINLP